MGTSDDVWVKKKLGNKFIPFQHRVAMMLMAAEDEDWIMVDGSRLVGNKMMENIGFQLNKIGVNARLIYVCGVDVIHRVVKFIDARFSILCVPRNGYDVKSQLSKCGNTNRIIVPSNWEENTISSTHIRSNFTENPSEIGQMLHSTVAQYMQNYCINLFFSDDMEK